MSTYANGSVTGTAAAANMLVYTGAAEIAQLTLSLVSVTGATIVTVNVYDNNVANSATAATGATWSGKSPGYTGRGPGTSRYMPLDYQSARYGDQQSQTAPNSAGVKQYWPVDGTSGDVNLAAAPTTRPNTATTNNGNGTFAEINATSETGNVVAAVTAARLLYTTQLIAGQSITWTPPSTVSVSYGVDVTLAAAGATAIVGSATLLYDPLP